MAVAPALTEVSLPPREPTSGGSATFSSSRLLSKIARSPTSSRRHRPIPSSGSGSDTVLDILPPPTPTFVPSQAVQHSRLNLPRPVVQRQISAPDTSVQLHSSENDGEAKHHSDVTGETVQQARAMLTKQPSSAGYVQPVTSTSGKTYTATNSNIMFSAPLVSEYYHPHQIASNGQNGAINTMYQQVHELSQKRIATLQYMRKAYEGRMFWFNTVHFSKRDIEKFSSHMPNRLSRRATNYFLLGISIPTVIDVHSLPNPSSSPKSNHATALELLKSLNTLLGEFESYQEKHPVDGSHVGSLSRARLPSMFKRSTTTSRPRKSSTAPSIEVGAQISPPAVPDTPYQQLHHSAHPSIDTATSTAVNSVSSSSTLVASQTYTNTVPLNSFSTTATFPPPGPPDAPSSSLLPNEASYAYLLTPPLPFAPDFYSVFATLCDVLIDTYQRILQLINGPNACSATLTELFSKTDAKIRKVMVGGIVKDFELASRENAKRELAGVQKVVLGGLMG